MKKYSKMKSKYTVISLIISIIFINIMASNKENIIEYKTNPDLPVIKKGWEGNVVINGAFHNDTIKEKPPLWNVIKWKLSLNSQRKEKKLDTFKLKSCHFDSITKSDNKIIWLGHSSFIIILNGVAIITDPSFFDLSVIKREISLPCEINTLKHIDYLLISHDHRDHFDKKSVDIIIENNPEIEALLPLNATRIFDTDKLKNSQKQEAGWYQEYNISADIRVIFLPARHWGRRGLFDFNKTLWGSFLIIVDDTKIFFSGDTAYDEKLFKEIHHEFGDIDICLLPIGAYSPKSVMETSHITPEEAVRIFNDLGGKIFIPMHYGTYDLSDEPLGEPIRRLDKCFNVENELKIKKLAIGEEYFITEK